jgi:hypothetical protein
VRTDAGRPAPQAIAEICRIDNGFRSFVAGTAKTNGHAARASVSENLRAWFEKRSRRPSCASRPEQYYRIEKPLPFIYDESESNFPLRHNRATIFFIGQHGRVS